MISSEGLQTVKNTVQQVKVGAVGRVDCGFLNVQKVFGDEITDLISASLMKSGPTAVQRAVRG